VDLPALGYLQYALLVIGTLNSVLSLFYYVKVLRVMVLERSLEELEGRAPAPLPVAPAALVYSGLLALVLVGFAPLWGRLNAEADLGVRSFQPAPQEPAAATAFAERRLH
jgi:NADH:ubiquinone oxidoreductase subunit 2 (subunit N)